MIIRENLKHRKKGKKNGKYDINQLSLVSNFVKKVHWEKSIH